jgi:acetolactate synthase-1/2/3 large subunit
VNGAQALIKSAVAAGVDCCFANPGTTELHLVAALDQVPGMRAVLGLFEGVCTGAADGYGRMLDRPAMTLLHLGPGFANGIANLHNARRARTPVINLVGDHATWHRASDAPLTTDIESLARPVSAWVRTSDSAAALPGDFAEAWRAASAAPGQVATLIAPADYQWGDGQLPVRPGAAAAAARVPAARIATICEALRDARRPALLLGGHALRAKALRAAECIAHVSGAKIWSETFPARLERGAGLPAVPKLPYFPDLAVEALAAVDTLVLVGARDPVAFFGYEGLPSRLAPSGAQLLTLAEPTDDCGGALEALVEALDAGESKPSSPPTPLPARPSRPSGPLNTATLGAALAALQPEGAIVVDESATSGRHYFEAAAQAPRHSYLGLTGGAIGQGLPCATGAAVACPDRQVIALQADGSALYTAQSLWTQAREGLKVVTLLCANRLYRILQIELARGGMPELGPAARALTELSPPALDWVAIASGFGVPARRVETADMLVTALEAAFAEPGPHLIEVLLP